MHKDLNTSIADNKIEALAESIWKFYYPDGGSMYRTYASLPEYDKKALREEAECIAEYLSGARVI